MKKVSLRKTSGMGITQVGNSVEFRDIKYSRMKKSLFQDIRAQLLNDTLNNITLSFTKYYNLDIDGVLKSKNIKLNLIVIPPDVAGIEYIKTPGITCSKYNKIIEIIQGSGIIIIQKFLNVNNQDIIISNVQISEKVIIPAGYHYSLINNKPSVLIALEFMHSKTQNKSNLDSMKGMSYYIIKKNAKKEVVKNPKYKIVCKFKKIDWKNYYKKYNMSPKTPIFRQLIRKPEKFDWFFKPAKENSESNIYG